MVLGKSAFDPEAHVFWSEVQASLRMKYLGEQTGKSSPPTVDLMEAVPVYTKRGCDPVF